MNKIFLYGPQPPLYSYGGPVRSLYSLRNVLNRSYDLICISPIVNLDGSKTNTNPTQKLIYSSTPFLTLINKCIKNKKPLVWFNSFFEIELLLLLFFSRLGFCNIILSPRGQLAPEAINSSKPKLKVLFISLFRILFPKSLEFHATDKSDEQSIKRLFKTDQIETIPNISSQAYHHNKNDNLNFVFFSRISKKKGLLELLECIDSNKLSIKLDIYGYREDHQYWSKCMTIIDKNIGVSYRGVLNQGDLSPLVNQYTFFIFPTYNENYGHVIFEALSLGMIPILSKGTTPFDYNINKIVGLNFDRASSESILNSINTAKGLSKKQIQTLREKLKGHFSNLLIDQMQYEKQYLTFVNNVIQKKNE